MAFAEPLKLEVKRRAHFRCCLCHSVYVEIHHILPEAEGGPDTEDNAAPLCPSCHETWGGNPDKRKFIREARDHWYEVCVKRVGYDSDQIREILADAIKGVATKEDLDRISVQNASYVLGSAGPGGRPSLDQLRYSFARAEFIHPRIVQELKGVDI